MRLSLDQSPLPSGFSQLLSAHFLPNTALNTDDKKVLVLNRTQPNQLMSIFCERDVLLALTSLPGKQATAVQTDDQQPKAEKPTQFSTTSDS
ncbi:MAG: hypothetical protein G5663_00590 [Serratia symbiotica]|nr:hypothetical protein [Serratia symbiotica]